MKTHPLHVSILAAILLSLLAAPVMAATSLESQAEIVRKINAKLHYQDGEITLPGGMAKLSLPTEFRYLGPEDADFVLTKLWRNPPGTKTLGMIFPRDGGPIGSNTWGVVITFSDDGYIKDSDADSIKYDKLLKEMKEAVSKANEERVKQGFPRMELVGWAATPHYDKESHKMYWAKDLKFADEQEHTLNYFIRVLGRRGVLNLNVVAAMNSLPEIEKSTPEIVGMVEFTEGNRYADFKKGTDKVAAYGLAALVAGGIAAKAGLFKMLFVALLAAKKFVIIGVVALVAVVKKLFSGRGPAQN